MFEKRIQTDEKGNTYRADKHTMSIAALLDMLHWKTLQDIFKCLTNDDLLEIFNGTTTRNTFILGDEMWDDLTDDQIARIYAIQDVLDEVDPKTIPERIKAFLSDIDPEVEIQIFEAIVSVYQEINSKYKLSLPEKRRLYGLLCLLTMGGEKTSRRVWADKNHLPSLRKIKRMWQKARAAIPPKNYSAYERKYGPGQIGGALFFE